MNKQKMTTLCFPVAALGLLLVVGSATSARAGAVDEMLATYEAAGAGPFDAARGEAAWTTVHLDAKTGQKRDCTTCHTPDLTAVGKHKKTGKRIEPLAPSANPERLTEVKTIKKWFQRNCKWTLGRLCTPQEKGDFLRDIQSQ